MTTSTFKCILYIAVATLTSLYTEISNIPDFNSLNSTKCILILLHTSVQGLIAWKAFIDQSITSENKATPPL